MRLRTAATTSDDVDLGDGFPTAANKIDKQARLSVEHAARFEINNRKITDVRGMDAGARFRTIASIAFTALIFALAATEVISAPSIMQANTLAFASADSLQCSLPDVDDERISVIIIDLLNDHSDSASNRVYLKEQKNEEVLIGSLIGLSRRQTRARAPPQSGIDDRRDSPCFISSLASSLWEPANASANFHQRFSTVQSRQGVLI